MLDRGKINATLGKVENALGKIEAGFKEAEALGFLGTSRKIEIAETGSKLAFACLREVTAIIKDLVNEVPEVKDDEKNAA